MLFRCCSLALCALLLVLVARGDAGIIEDHFDIQSGTLPIIILAPHGGTLAPPNVDARTLGNPGDVYLNDFKTNLLAAQLSAELQSLTGLQPYYVINKIDREYLDLNRDKTDNGGFAAYEDLDAQPYYDYYHSTVQSYVDDVFNTWGTGLLLDIHGQSQDLDLVYRGTQNGQTVTSMLNLHGEVALTGPNSIFGQLAAKGYNVDPANVLLAVDPEVTFVGGHTVQTYGSGQPGGIDAIQIEFGRDYRDTMLNPNIWQQTAIDLAAATQAYHSTFLVPEPDSLVLALIALLSLAGLWRRRR